MLYTLFNIHPHTTAADIQAMVMGGANPNGRDEDNRTPLHFVCTAEQVRALVAAGADVQATDEWCSSPLHDSQNEAVTLALLQAHADPNARDSDDCVPLHCARNVAQARALLEAGAQMPDDLAGDASSYAAQAQLEMLIEQELQPRADRLAGAPAPAVRPRRRA